MSDARALLKAKRQEARISHPHATYTSAGQLKCILCAAPVKFASAWEGHLGSKVHRTNLARLREEERLEKERLEQEQQLQEEESHKRKRSPLVDHDLSDDDEMDTDESRGSKKRRADSDRSNSLAGPSAGGFPQDFFSDPSRKPVPLTPDSDDDENENESAMVVDPPKPGTTTKSTSDVDLEYERFQRELLQQSASSEDVVEKFERATVFAEPELSTDHEAGFPAKDAEQAVGDPANAIPPEEEIRKKREQDDRELIMDRLMDEERAQEDADNRVLQMKSRLEAIRKRKEGLKKQK